MAKATTIKIKLLSTADTGYFYVTKKNSRTQTDKLSFRKSDPVAKKHVEFKETKIQTPLSELCQGFPKEFQDYLSACRTLEFKETPPYSTLRDNFKALMKSLGHKYDYQFDWTEKEEKD